jgi:CubicO group peptidase (beta-lactamase class C family)
MARSVGYYPPSDAAGGWRSRRPSRAERSKFDAAFERAAESTKHGGLLVAHRGLLVYERYFGLACREATPNTASCGKAFTSIALGILLGQRPDLFPDGLDQKVFTPRYLPAEAFPLDDPVKAEIKLGQLLAMSAGLTGNNPAYVRGKEVKLKQTGADGWQAMVDRTAFTTPLWTKPGEGYCYATVGPHIVSIILRHLTGMELQDFLEQNVALPLGWGRWGFAYRRTEVTHTPGGGGIAIRSTDMLRFAYLLLREGSWAGRQIVPASYVRLCGRRSPYNPHYPFSFQFNVNTDGDLAPGAPRDAFWKGGSGGHCFYVVPSLDLVIYKLGGRDAQFDLAQTNVPPPPDDLLPHYDGSRESWKPPHSESDSIPTADVLKLVTQAFH